MQTISSFRFFIFARVPGGRDPDRFAERHILVTVEISPDTVAGEAILSKAYRDSGNDLVINRDPIRRTRHR